MYGMYTEEGDDAVDEALYKALKGWKKSEEELDANDILSEIQLSVLESGKDQVNPHKYNHLIDEKGQYEIVVGFGEVNYDTNIENRILSEIYSNADFSDEDEEEESNNEESDEESEEESDSTKRKREESDDDCENSKPCKSIKNEL